MIGTILMFIFQVPYKKFDKEKYFKYLWYIYLLQGEYTCISISVITFSAGGEHITYFLQGEYSCTQSVIIKKGELAFDDTFVKTFQWSSISQAYTRVLHAQDIPKRVLWMCIVMFNSMLKALKHKHTHTS